MSRSNVLNEIGDLRHMDASAARQGYSVVLERTVREPRGTACLDLEDRAVNRQQIICSRSFGAETQRQNWRIGAELRPPQSAPETKKRATWRAFWLSQRPGLARSVCVAVVAVSRLLVSGSNSREQGNFQGIWRLWVPLSEQRRLEREAGRGDSVEQRRNFPRRNREANREGTGSEQGTEQVKARHAAIGYAPRGECWAEEDLLGVR